MTGLGLLAGCGRWPWQAQAPPQVYRLGVFHVGADHVPSSLSGLREGLQALGYVEGQNLELDWRNVVDESAASATAEQFVRERQAIVDRNLRLFGTGRDDRLFEIGPNPELIGKDPAAVGLQPLDTELAYAGEYRDVDTGSTFIPAHVVARVRDGGEGGREIAVAVNGTIVAVGETFTLAKGDEGELVSVMVPPESFEQGRNEVEVFEAA